MKRQDKLTFFLTPQSSFNKELEWGWRTWGAVMRSGMAGRGLYKTPDALCSDDRKAVRLNTNVKWKRHKICKDCVLYSQEVNEGVLVAAPADRAASGLQESAGPARRGVQHQAVSCATLSSGLSQAGSAKSLSGSRNTCVTRTGKLASFPTATSPLCGRTQPCCLRIRPRSD